MVYALKYRVAAAAAIAGMLAFGMILLNIVTNAFREQIFLFYGLNDEEYAQASTLMTEGLTLTHVAVVAALLFAVITFIVVERRRMAAANRISPIDRVEVTRLTARQLIDVYVVRASLMAGGLFSCWTMQQSTLRWRTGLEWNLAYDPRSLLPIASIFGLCCLVGLLVAAISLVGIRAITQLEAIWMLVSRITRRRPVLAFRVWRKRKDEHWRHRDQRERFGLELLSRPPPSEMVVTV
jgi:hypothetical protein